MVSRCPDVKPDRFAEVRRLESAAIVLMMAADRQWWRFLRNRGRHREALRLLDEAGAAIDAVPPRRTSPHYYFYRP
jgi:hypothetical protein